MVKIFLSYMKKVSCYIEVWGLFFVYGVQDFFCMDGWLPQRYFAFCMEGCPLLAGFSAEGRVGCNMEGVCCLKGWLLLWGLYSALRVGCSIWRNGGCCIRFSASMSFFFCINWCGIIIPVAGFNMWSLLLHLSCFCFMKLFLQYLQGWLFHEWLGAVFAGLALPWSVGFSIWFIGCCLESWLLHGGRVAAWSVGCMIWRSNVWFEGWLLPGELGTPWINHCIIWWISYCLEGLQLYG